MGYEKKAKKKTGKIEVPTSREEEDKELEARQDLDAAIRHHAVKKDPERLKRMHQMATRRLDENKGKLAETKHAIALGKKGGDN
jgi:hypothetical protein